MKIFMADASVFQNKDYFEAAYHLMPEERQRKIDRFRFQKDKILSLTAGVLLRRALREKGIEKEEILLTPEGKPYLKDKPELFFNLSHSGTRALCVVANHPVGCDIERLESPPLMVGPRVFSAKEQEALSALTGEGLMRQFFRLWTGKESYLKMTGEGLGGKPCDFSINLPLGSQKIKEREVTFFDISGDRDYQVTICAEGFWEKDETVSFLKNRAYEALDEKEKQTVTEKGENPSVSGKNEKSSVPEKSEKAFGLEKNERSLVLEIQEWDMTPGMSQPPAIEN